MKINYLLSHFQSFIAIAEIIEMNVILKKLVCSKPDVIKRRAIMFAS